MWNQNSKRVARDERNILLVSLGFPFAEFGSAQGESVPFPGELEGFLATGGNGGSIMSDSVRMGFGASAGGKY